jgi:chaperonin GroES
MKTQTVTPLFDNVLIKPSAGETKTPGGILLPESAKEKPQMGTVMAMGPGALDKDGNLVKMLVKVGDKVLYKKWGGNEVKMGTEEWLIVEQKDILATVK